MQKMEMSTFQKKKNKDGYKCTENVSTSLEIENFKYTYIYVYWYIQIPIHYTYINDKYAYI